MDNFDVVKKLIGEIYPIGETQTDDIRFENLKAMCELSNRIISEIDNMSFRYKNSTEYSVKRAYDYANKYLDKIGIGR